MASSNSTANLPAPSQKTLGLDDSRTSTNEEARPIPYVAGWQRVGVTWLDDPRNQTSTPVASTSSGKSKSSGPSGYKYHADMVALVCLGPVDALTHVFFDSQVVWSGVIERGGASSATITIEHKGPMTIYWGTADQPANDALAGAGHPAYRNQCYLYFSQLGFGQDRTNAPNVEIGLRRRPYFDWLPSGAPSDDCNPVVALADLLTNPLFGLGQPASMIDQPQWAAVAAQIAGEDAVCSPHITESTAVRQLITQLCEYFGGYLRWTADNKLQIGLFRDPPPDIAALPKLTGSDLLDAPEIEAGEWSSTYNRTLITCVERSRDWKEDYGQWLDQGNYALTGQTRFQQLERRWITRTAVATRLAARVGKQAALPQFSGTLRVRASSAETILVGNWLVLDWDGWGFALVLQCTGRRLPSDATPEVELDVTGQQVSEDPAELYDRADVINHSPDGAAVEPLAQWRMIELPKALAAGAVAPTLAPLAVRGGFATVFAHVLDSQDLISYDFLDDFTQFAIGGTLAADYPQETDALDLSVGMLVNLVGPDLALPGQSDIAMENGKLLVFVGDEILSVRQFTYVSATQVRVFATRGKFDTGQLAHAAGEEVYVIKQRHLTRMTADAFSEDQQIAFKLQPGSIGEQFDLSLVDAQTLTIVGRDLMPQPFTHLIVSGTPAADGPTYTTDDSIQFDWTLTTNETFGFEGPPEDYFAESGIGTVIKVYDSSSALTIKRKLTAAPGEASLIYRAADIEADFGGSAPATMYVRLWSRKAGRTSFSFEQATITKL